jgi:hypothetical protein
MQSCFDSAGDLDMMSASKMSTGGTEDTAEAGYVASSTGGRSRWAKKEEAERSPATPNGPKL